MLFGELVRKRRLERGIALRELARRLGISAAYLSDIEHGNRTPSVQTMGGRLAELLDIPVEVLYYSQGQLPPDLPRNATSDQVVRAFGAMRDVLNEAAARRTATPRPARQDAGRENNERQKDEG